MSGLKSEKESEGLHTREFIQPDMNEDEWNIEPVTDLGLALGHSNQYIQKRLKNDSGAGANAGSREDMTFMAPDPVSELVWSPQKGLSLKCADRRFANRKPSLAWGAGPSNVILLPPQEAFHLKSEIGAGDTLAKSSRSDTGIMPLCGSSHEQRKGTGDSAEEMNMAVTASVIHINQKEDLRDSKGYGICGGLTNTQPAELSEARENNLSSFPEEPKFDAAPSEPSSRDTIGRARDVGSGNQTSNECKAYDTSVQNLAFPSAIREESASIMEKESKSKMKETGSPSVPPLEKLESTAENDLQTLLSETACGAARKIVASESDHGKKSFWQDEEILPSVSDKHSPTNSRIRRYRRKGKAKAFFYGDVNAKESKNEDDSHESVESCNSAGLFSTGKKRRNFEQQLTVGSKRVKKHIEESPGSTSFMKQDSSFMNWISNMMKGFLKSDQDEAPVVALTLAHPGEHERPDQKLVTCNTNQDPRCRNMGFQSIFQSLYCPKKKVQETRMLDDNYQAELELATPIACCEENENFCKKVLLSNENFNESTSGNGASLATQPKLLPFNFAASQENSKSHSAPAKNKTLGNLATGKEKEGTSFNSSLGKRKTSNGENIDSDPPSEGKTTHNINSRSEFLGSLWITRFTPKTAGPSSNRDHCKRNTSAALECSTDFMRLISCSQDHVDVSNNLKIVEVKQHSTEDPLNVVHKDLQNCAVNTEAYIDFNIIKGNNEQESTHILNPIVPTSRFKNSKAMASVFARRLDALKHIMPSEITENAACVTITCFYCGRKGHHLRDCSDITDTELEDLLKNTNSYNWMQELHCLCIKCFQLNHWAVACPNASSKGRHQSGCGASLVDDCSPSEIQLNARNDEIPKLLDGVENQFQAAGTSTVCDGNDPKIEIGLNLNWKLNDTKTSDKLRSNASSVRKFIASSPGENKLNENQITPLCNYVNRQISDIPMGIFYAIKRLRLTRTDILKWMDSCMPLPHLDGFYLRLRLGKWEKGLGGTGYYVACISGAQRESSPQKSKYSLSVSVGGIKCLVESQYISNHDFLEDELMAWWSATAKSGGKIPAEENLRLKLKERIMLGI